jgi:hypothetical protein
MNDARGYAAMGIEALMGRNSTDYGKCDKSVIRSPIASPVLDDFSYYPVVICV